MINVKSDKAITMITLIIAILIMLVISSTLIYNMKMGIESRTLNNLYSDIQVLKDKTDLYYSKYGTLPILKTSYTNVKDIKSINENDGEQYYIIDLESLENLTLNYGKGYEELKQGKPVSEIVDIYVVNEQSHNIYYIKGITLDGKTYHTMPGKYTQVSLPTIANISLDEVSGDTATVSIKAINKGEGISDITLYVSNEQYKKYTYESDNTKMRIETVKINDLEFEQEITCYIEVTTTDNKKTRSNEIKFTCNRTLVENSVTADEEL